MKWCLKGTFVLITFGHIQNTYSSELWQRCKTAVARTVVDAFDLTVEEQQIFTSRDGRSNSVVLTHASNDVGVKKAKACRIDDDTVLLVRAEHADGSQQMLVSSCSKHNYANQLGAVQKFALQHGVCGTTMKAVVLAAYYDRDRELVAAPMYRDEQGKVLYWPQEQDFWQTYRAMLAAMGVDSTIVPYAMVPGSCHEPYHFEATLDKHGVTWRSATHGFTDRKL